MSDNREGLHALVDRIPDAEIPLAERFLQFLSTEPIGPEFSKSLRRSITQADAGETIPCTNYDEMAEKLLGEGQD